MELKLCPECEGTGFLDTVTREMALDAGMPEIEGTRLKCPICNGEGVIIDDDGTKEKPKP